MDNSFIKLHTSIEDAVNSLIGDYKTSNLVYSTSLQMSPNESYLQITNIEGGITFNGSYDVHIVDSCNNVLHDISERVFIDQQVDQNGFIQCAIEYLPILKDFYGRAVLIRFTNTVNSDQWYSNPIKITDHKLENTIRFDYKNFENINGVSYESLPYFQSIRILCEYVKPIDNSEADEYYQISNGNTISARLLEKTAHEYRLRNLDLFTYSRVKKMFKHNEIYIDNEKVTNNPLLKEEGRLGRTNLIQGNFNIYRNEADVYESEFQIYEGALILRTLPSGLYTLSSLQNEGDYKCEFNSEITIGTGTLRVYNADGNVLINTYTEADAFLDDNLTLAFGGVLTDITTNGSYYVQFDAGLVSVLGIPFGGINDTTTWTFEVTNGDYDSNDYDSNDYFTD